MSHQLSHPSSPSSSIRLLLIAALIVVCRAMPVASEPTQLIPDVVDFQGLLLDSAGDPLSGPVDIFVEVFDAEADGNATYYEEHSGVALTDGIFSIHLGTGANASPADGFQIPAFATRNHWIEITVNGEVMIPRQQVSGVPYAGRSEHAQVAGIALDAAKLGGIQAEAFQVRIMDACAVGYSIRQVNVDGSVECEYDSVNAGDNTAVSPGSGLTGGGDSGDVSLSVDSNFVQRRIAVGCAAGWSIRQVNPDGSVQCEDDSVNAGDITAVIAGSGLSGGASAGDASLAVAAGGITAAHLGTGAVDASKLSSDVDARYVNVAGDTMTGTLVLPDFGLAVGSSQRSQLRMEPDLNEGTRVIVGNEVEYVTELVVHHKVDNVYSFVPNLTIGGPPRPSPEDPQSSSLAPISSITSGSPRHSTRPTSIQPLFRWFSIAGLSSPSVSCPRAA